VSRFLERVDALELVPVLTLVAACAAIWLLLAVLVMALDVRRARREAERRRVHLIERLVRHPESFIGPPLRPEDSVMRENVRRHLASLKSDLGPPRRSK
jgi:hypothetical protein